MAFKPIIDIDVNDEKFKDFLAAFGDFLDETKEVPEPFKEMGDKIDKARTAVGRLGADIDRKLKKAGGAAAGVSTGVERTNKALDAMPDKVKRGSREIEKMGHAGRRTFQFLGREIEKVAGILPVIGGFLAGGATLALAGVALYGRESKTITDRFKGAKALGMKPGSRSALETAYSPYLENAPATVQQFGEAYQSYQGRAALARVLGPGYAAMSKHAAFEAAMQKAQAFAKAHSTASFEAMDRAMGFANLGITASDLRILKHTRTASIAAAAQNANQQRKVLNFSRQTGHDMSKLHVTMAQAEVQLSTDLARTMAKGAPEVRTAIHSLAMALNKGVNQINEALRGRLGKTRMLRDYEAARGKRPEKHPLLHTMVRAVFGGVSAQERVKIAESAMERAEGTGRHPAAKAHYEKVKAAYDAALKAQWWRRIHNPMDIEAFKGDPSYLNQGNGIRYAKFASNAADYRKAAQLVRSYGRHTLAGIMTAYEGHAPSVKNLAAASKASGFAPNQALDLSSNAVMAHVLTGIRITEQPHQRSVEQLLQAILRAIQGQQTTVHVHANNSPNPAGRIFMQAHAAAR